MSNVVNLKKARKHKERQARSKKAQENRVAFGRTKAEKTYSLNEIAQRERQLDGHRRSGDDNP